MHRRTLLVVLCSLATACGYNAKSNDTGAGDGALGGSTALPDAAVLDAASENVDVDVGAGETARPENPEAGPVDSLAAADAGRGEDVLVAQDRDAPISGTGGVGGAGGGSGGGGGARDAGTDASAGTPASSGTAGQSGTGGAGTGGTTLTISHPSISSFSATPESIGEGKSSTLTWAVTGAIRLTIDQGVGVVTDRTSITVTPAETTVYTLTAENAAGAKLTRQARVTVVASPTITGFVAMPEIISAGSNITLSAVFSGGDATVDQGVGTVSSEAVVTCNPLETTTYTLTVTNALGETKTATAKVTVVPLPTISSFQAALTPIASGSSTTLTANFENGTGSIDQSIGNVTSGTPFSTGALTSAKTYTLTVTNPAGTAKTATVTVVAVGPGHFASVRMLKWMGGGHTATLLPNGKVLIAGGMNDTDGHAELYEPATQTFVATGPMTGPRVNHTATLLANGKVLICGGEPASGDSQSTAELYDPTTGKFVATGRMIKARAHHAALLLADGTVLVTGGQGGVNRYDDGELYDPDTGTFAAIGTRITQGFLDHTMLSVPTTPPKFLILGGNGGKTVYSYDPASQSFPPLGAMNATRNYSAIALLPNNSVLLAGGLDQTLVIVKSAEVYDPDSQTSVATSDMTVPRSQAASVVLADGTVLVIGGQKVNGVEDLASSEIYNPTSRVFTASGNMAFTRVGHTATALPNRKVLVVGGYTNQTDPGAELYFY